MRAVCVVVCFSLCGGGCIRTVDVALADCADVDVHADEVDVDCDDVPELCGLAVTSEDARDDGKDVIDLVFVEVGGRRGADFAASVAQRMRQHRADAVSIVGRDPGLFRVHVVEVPEPPWFGDDPLPACVSGDGLGSGVIADFSSARVALAARNAPVDADIVVAVYPEVIGRVRETARGNIIAVSFDDDDDAFDHELGHALVGLGDEYAEFDACCDDADDEFAVVVGDAGITGYPNVVRDEAAATFDGLVDVAEGGGGCSRCWFHADASCTMNVSSTTVRWCPVCERAIEARLADFSADHTDALPTRCRLGALTVPTRGEAVRGRADAEGFDDVRVSLDVDGRVTDVGAAFVVDAAATAGARAASLVATCADGDDVVVRTLPFR